MLCFHYDVPVVIILLRKPFLFPHVIYRPVDIIQERLSRAEDIGNARSEFTGSNKPVVNREVQAIMLQFEKLGVRTVGRKTCRHALGRPRSSPGKRPQSAPEYLPAPLKSGFEPSAPMMVHWKKSSTDNTESASNSHAAPAPRKHQFVQDLLIAI